MFWPFPDFARKIEILCVRQVNFLLNTQKGVCSLGASYLQSQLERRVVFCYDDYFFLRENMGTRSLGYIKW